MNATAFSQTGCSDLASAPELSPSGARAAATSPSAFMNKPHPFPTLTKPPFLQNLTHTTRPDKRFSLPVLHVAGLLSNDMILADCRPSPKTV